jgi:hypothetical protein
MVEKPKMDFEVPVLPKNIHVKQGSEDDKEEKGNFIAHSDKR